jgi:hypothetical protein
LNYADDAIRELAETSIREILSAGKYLYLEELACEIVDTSLNLVETLKEEEDNQEDTQETRYYYSDDENQEDTQE